MYLIFKNFHSVFAFLSLFILFFTIAFALFHFFKKKPFAPTVKFLSLLALIAAHIQFLFGIALYLLSPMGLSNFSSESMKNSFARLYILEHPLMMIIAIILITIGYSRSKRAALEAAKFKRIIFFYSLGVVLILSRIPWGTW